MLKIIPATTEHAWFVAMKMRKQDRMEIMLSTDSVPMEALMNGLNKSDKSWTVMVRDVPVVMFGVRRTTIVTNSGVIWMLGTDMIEDIPYQFVKTSKKILDELLTEYDKVYNYIWEQNTVSMMWLKWLGFTVHDPIPYGVHKANFCLFEKRKEPCVDQRLSL